MRESNYIEREEFLKDHIKHWGNCYGCSPTEKGFKTELGESVEMYIDGFKAVVVFKFDAEVSAVYSLSLETGATLMIKNEFLPGGKLENESAGLISDFFGGIWGDEDEAIFTLMNKPIIIDTTLPEIKPMPLEEIWKEIVRRINSSSDESENEEESK